MAKKENIIGIDTGVNTGVGISTNGKIVFCKSMTITEAMKYILENYPPETTRLYIEDARKWVGYHGKTADSESKRQGAGSVKRDAKIWEDWCKENEYTDTVFLSPVGTQKLDAKLFKRYTGYTGRTNQHGRDAGMIAFVRGQR